MVYILRARVWDIDFIQFFFGGGAIEVGVLLSVGGFVVDIYDDLAIFVFYVNV